MQGGAPVTATVTVAFVPSRTANLRRPFLPHQSYWRKLDTHLLLLMMMDGSPLYDLTMNSQRSAVSTMDPPSGCFSANGGRQKMAELLIRPC